MNIRVSHIDSEPSIIVEPNVEPIKRSYIDKDPHSKTFGRKIMIYEQGVYKSDSKGYNQRLFVRKKLKKNNGTKGRD